MTGKAQGGGRSGSQETLGRGVQKAVPAPALDPVAGGDPTRTLATFWCLFLLLPALAPPLFGGAAREQPGVSGSSPAPGPGYPRSVTDDTGRTFTLAAPPGRIVSLTLGTDEILLSLVARERLVGVTTFAADPRVSNIASQVAEGPAKLTANTEVILSLRPDIVFVANWSEADKVRQLREAGLAVYLVQTPLTVAGVEKQILTLGTVVGAEKEAAGLAAWMERRLTTLQERLGALGAGRRLTVMDYTVGGVAMGRGSTWDEIVHRAGLINAAGEDQADEWGQVPVSRERLLELDPDILVVPDWVYGDPDGAERLLQRIAHDPALAGLAAVRSGRVYAMPERLRASTSQHIVEAVEWLAHKAYPGLFQQ